MEIKNRIINYWSRRSGDFARLRRDELNSYMADLWLEEIRKYLPDKPCRILDIGTGSGFFAILLGKAGHYVEGIDLTASMIEEAKLLAAKSGEGRCLRRQRRAFPRLQIRWGSILRKRPCHYHSSRDSCVLRRLTGARKVSSALGVRLSRAQ